MYEFVSLKRLRIKKEEIQYTYLEKQRIRKKAFIFFGLFVLSCLIMVPLQESYLNSEISEAGFNIARGLLKFGGVLFWIGLFLGYRVYRLGKEIKLLKKHYKHLADQVNYLNN
jgi:hypothetical protein